MSEIKQVVEIPKAELDALMNRLNNLENNLARVIIDKINQEFISKNGLMSELDLANYLGKHKKTIATWRIEGKITPVYVADNPYYRLSDIVKTG